MKTMVERRIREMADIRLHNKLNTVTNVPNRFIDEYMTNANGEFVKIYLYLLRCMNTPDCDFSISMIADKLEHTERDVTRALKYWESKNLLHLEYDLDNSLSGIYLVDLQSQTAPFSYEAPAPQLNPGSVSPQTQQAPSPSPAAAMQQNRRTQPTAMQQQNSSDPASQKRSYSLDELARFQESDDVQELVFISSQYLGRQLNQSELNSMFYWYDSLHFCAELIEYLIEYCIGKGHTSFHYMDKVATAWAENHISTVEQAKQQSAAYSQDVYTVMRAFGINGRNLVDFETSYIRKWTGEYGFTADIITEACRRTMQSIQKPSFEYADTILSNWKRNNVHHMEDIVKLDTAFQKSKTNSGVTLRQNNNASKNKFNNFPQRSYDYDELERQLLENGIH